MLKVGVYREMVVNLSAESLRTPGVESLLPDLRENDFQLAVASASGNAQLLLDRSGLGKYFEYISDGHFQGEPKPSPSQLLHVASQVNVAPGDCVVIEDSSVGIEAAVCRREWLPSRSGARPLPILRQVSNWPPWKCIDRRFFGQHLGGIRPCSHRSVVGAGLVTSRSLTPEPVSHEGS